MEEIKNENKNPETDAEESKPEEKKVIGIKDKKNDWMVIKLSKPVNNGGPKVNELDMRGMNDLTLDDMVDLYSLYDRMGGGQNVLQESSMLFAKLTAQRITGLPLETIGRISARDAAVLKARIYRFFYIGE